MQILKDSPVPLPAAWSGKPHHNPQYDPAKPHHTPAGFRNNYPHGRPSRQDFARWSEERRRKGLPPPAADLSCVAPDLDFLHANRGRTAVTWIGHAHAGSARLKG